MNIILSIIIIEYNSIAEIKQCISNYQKALDGINYELIVSSNSMYNLIKQQELICLHPDVIWVFNAKNGGFAYGMNRGLSKASGQYLVISNPDVIIISGIKKSILFLESNKKIGALGPQMINKNGYIQDTCREYVSLSKILIRQIRRCFLKTSSVLNPNFNYDTVQTVDWIIGAYIMISREVYENVGGLDESYFMYCEDVDWCTRIREAGFEIVYFPYMKLIYEGTRSARKLNRYTWIFLKSHFIYWRKFGFFCGYPTRKKLFFD